MNLSVIHLCNISILFQLNIKVLYLCLINLCICPTITASVNNRQGSILFILFLFKFTCKLKVL